MFMSEEILKSYLGSVLAERVAEAVRDAIGANLLYYGLRRRGDGQKLGIRTTVVMFRDEILEAASKVFAPIAGRACDPASMYDACRHSIEGGHVRLLTIDNESAHRAEFGTALRWARNIESAVVLEGRLALQTDLSDHTVKWASTSDPLFDYYARMARDLVDASLRSGADASQACTSRRILLDCSRRIKGPGPLRPEGMLSG